MTLEKFYEELRHIEELTNLLNSEHTIIQTEK